MAKGEKSASGSLREGIQLYRIKRWEAALEELLAVNPAQLAEGEGIELAYYLGLCYTKLARYEEALLYLEQVVTSGEDPLRVYQCRMVLAYIYLETGRSKMAEFELGRLAGAGFESAQLYNAQGYAAWAQKRFPEAVECYEKALGMDEQNGTALNGIGYVLVDGDIDITRGLAYCKQAVELRPRNAAYLDSLGWAYFKHGELPEARLWMRRALDAAPEEQVIREHYRIVAGGRD
ncbi:MAG: tetratricopeptide repeat protein [Treponema sp.]|jgi:tetratricopeptide (TPR) repeat protein|nr:tetratricopeptide repeat protein [Treponema sp.]